MEECFGLKSAVCSDYKNRCRDLNIFEQWFFSKKNLRISENTNCSHEHCRM